MPIEKFQTRKNNTFWEAVYHSLMGIKTAWKGAFYFRLLLSFSCLTAVLACFYVHSGVVLAMVYMSIGLAVATYMLWMAGEKVSRLFLELDLKSEVVEKQETLDKK